METKPAIVLPYDSGKQNADLARAQARLDASKSYKNLSTVIVTPTRGGRSLTPRWFSAVLGMMRPMNQPIYGPMFIEGMEVGEAFNAAVEMIMGNPQLSKFKFLLTLEDDNLPPPDGLIRLYEGTRDYDVIGGLYWTKGDDGQPMIYGDPIGPLNFVPQRPIENTLQRCNGLGMGFTLFKLDIFRRLPKPWFKTRQEHDPVRGTAQYTQDLYAFEAMAKMGGIRVACDTRIRVGHLDPDTGIVW